MDLRTEVMGIAKDAYKQGSIDALTSAMEAMFAGGWTDAAAALQQMLTLIEALP